MIPQFDLKKEYALLEKEIQHELKKVFTKTNFISGENVKLVEYNIANYIGSKYAVSCNSGTDALHFALKSLGIGKGDEVITTPFTFISTLEAIIYVGATPVFADIDFNTYNININEILKKVSKNTKAILPVHIFGNPVDINLLKEKLNNNSINIIEDCAQSFGAGINHRRVGSISNIGCFSFYPTKNLGCYGDGGMITTNSEDAYNQIKKLKNHGSLEKYHHDIIGYNSRLDEMQAAILNIKLKYIDQNNAKRVKNAEIYNDQLSKLNDIQIPQKTEHGYHVYHQYTINSILRDKIKANLEKNKIGSAIYYPISLEKQKAYKESNNNLEELKNSNHLANTCLSLPMYPHLTEKDIIKVCEVIKKTL